MFARSTEVPRGHVQREEPALNPSVLRTQPGRLLKKIDRFALPALLEEIVGDHLQVGHCTSDVAEVLPGGGSCASRLKVRRIERAKAGVDFCGATPVAAFQAPRSHGSQVRTCIHEHALPGRNLGRLQRRMLVVGTNLQDLLVERCGFREEAFLHQAVGDADELIDGLVGLAGPHVQVAENIRRRPVSRLIFDDADVFGDGRLELPLLEQLLGIAPGPGAINGHVVI